MYKIKQWAKFVLSLDDSVSSLILALWYFRIGGWGEGFSSVQFSRSVVSDSLWPHELQHARPPCPSPIPGAYPNSKGEGLEAIKSKRPGYHRRKEWPRKTKWLTPVHTAQDHSVSLLAHSLGHRHPCALPPGLKQIYWVPFIGRMRSFIYLFLKSTNGKKIVFGCTRSLLWHSESLVVAYGILFPDQWLNPSPLHWEHVVLVTGPPGKSQNEIILKSYKFGEHSLLLPGNFIPQHLNKNMTVNTLFEWTYKLLASVKH